MHNENIPEEGLWERQSPDRPKLLPVTGEDGIQVCEHDPLPASENGATERKEGLQHQRQKVTWNQANLPHLVASSLCEFRPMISSLQDSLSLSVTCDNIHKRISWEFKHTNEQKPLSLSLWWCYHCGFFYSDVKQFVLYYWGKKEGEKKSNRVRSDVYGKMSPWLWGPPLLPLGPSLVAHMVKRLVFETLPLSSEGFCLFTSKGNIFPLLL